MATASLLLPVVTAEGEYYLSGLYTAAWLVFPLILGVLALVVRDLYYELATLAWPCVVGKVNHSGAEERSISHDYATSSVVEPVIIYEYNVDGKVYRNSQISIRPLGWLGSFGFGSEESRMFHLAFPPGSPISVYYNPTNPQEAVLLNGISSKTKKEIVALAGGTLLEVGIVITYLIVA